MLRIKFIGTFCEIALIMWMPQKPFDDKSTLVQVMAWCHQALQAIILATVDPDLCCYMSSLGHNVLNLQYMRNLPVKFQKNLKSTVKLVCWKAQRDEYVDQCKSNNNPFSLIGRGVKNMLWWSS